MAASAPTLSGAIAAPRAAPSAPRGASALALLRGCRPRQWAKNVLVAAAPLAAGVLGRPRVLADVLGALLAFCLLSSATYLINDVRDREQDRRHPLKRLRPVAAGTLSVRGAVLAAAVLAIAGLALAGAVRPALALVGLGYMTVTASYSLLWRRIVVADVVAVAAGFVLRAIGGGVAADVYLSRWFLLVSTFCALFLITGKRYAELRELSARTLTRATLRRYTPGLLRAMLATAGLLACLAYLGWAIARPEHGPWNELSIAPFVLWLARYRRLLGSGAGGAPEDLILGDRGLIALSLCWLALFVGGVYVGR